MEEAKEKLKASGSTAAPSTNAMSAIPSAETQRLWADTLAVTIQGIAAGMQNTG
jgi:hypothetical protein